ncbi:hypothetical protein AA18895_0821 [Acetobacter ghanensis DSM 18895]|nr:hypothetical protein AA18895_0821 [Acetobacter ghanensis DSM 18895]
MHMLAFRKEHLRQVALYTRLHRYVGNGHNRAQLRQFHGHVASMNGLYRHGLALAGISGAVA